MKRFALPVALRTRSPVRHQRGMSIVELLVAMTIGLFLMGAVGAIYVATSNSSRGSTLESQMNEDASLALEMLQQQIRLAGYSGFNATGARNFQGLGVRGCDGGFSDNTATTRFDGMACGTTTTGSDAIAIRYEASALNTQATAAGRPTNCSFTAITAWDIGGGITIPLADNRYYVAADTANDNIPTLFCRGMDGSGGTGFDAATALIPNIEDMQIRYAITAMPVTDDPMPHQITSYVDASNAVLGATLSNWSRVAGVHICLLARTSRPVPSSGGSRAELGSYVDCNGVRQDGNEDGFLRRAYHTTVQLRNMRPAVPANYGLAADGSVRNPWAHLSGEQ
ncbi:PilW family protein [Hydrogenophaga palleronii]|uniref:PilW family protein n=1 Tax=Hydrogenophaga palleronii TaxID=65655 RepID=UPI0008245FE9|nr:PilW family protein [Hydrogenophaga palleronii]